MRIVGAAGSGKSLLGHNTIQFIEERGFLDGGCVYLNCRDITELSIFFEGLTQRITNDKSMWI